MEYKSLQDLKINFIKPMSKRIWRSGRAFLDSFLNQKPISLCSDQSKKLLMLKMSKRAQTRLTLKCGVCSAPAPEHFHFGGERIPLTRYNSSSTLSQLNFLLIFSSNYLCFSQLLLLLSSFLQGRRQRRNPLDSVFSTPFGRGHWSR